MTSTNEEILKTLKSIERNSEEQRNSEKKRYTMTLIATTFIVIISFFIIGSGIFLSNRVNRIYNDVSTTMESFNAVAENMAEIDFEKLSKDFDILITDTEVTIKTTNEKLNAIDFDALNEAITDLRNLIKPLADFFHR